MGLPMSPSDPRITRKAPVSFLTPYKSINEHPLMRGGGLQKPISWKCQLLWREYRGIGSGGWGQNAAFVENNLRKTQKMNPERTALMVQLLFAYHLTSRRKYF